MPLDSSCLPEGALCEAKARKEGCRFGRNTDGSPALKATHLAVDRNMQGLSQDIVSADVILAYVFKCRHLLA